MNAIEMAETTQLDESAVAAVRAGDAERYRELVERHQRRVFAVAWSRLGDATLAEEATQEAFIRAYRRLWLLGDGAKFSGWIATIARRVAINFGIRHRRELNKRERWALENFPETAPENVSAEDELPHSPETLRQTLAELPDSHRECLVLFYLEGKSGAEAAAALGISEAALRVRLHRARAALRERLERKLESSLEKLRPAKSLVPAVMAGVLTSSSAKAVTGGTTVLATLAKFTPLKWLFVVFPIVLPAITILPAMLVHRWRMNQERKNFRDQAGFRARLYGKFDRRFFIGFSLLLIICLVLTFGMNRVSNAKTFFFIIGLFSAVNACLSGKQLQINRTWHQLNVFLSGIILAGVCIAVGMGWLPTNAVFFAILLSALPNLFRSRSSVMMRMDYNLFLRASERMLPELAPPACVGNRTRIDRAALLAFARFLTERWLVSTHNWKTNGLALRMRPVKAYGSSENNSWWSLFLGKPSSIVLGWDGSVEAHCSDADARELSLLREEPVSKIKLEREVADAVTAAWVHFQNGNPSLAERALGQVPDRDIFAKPPGRLTANLWTRWSTATVLVLCSLSLVCMRLPGCRALFARLDGLRPVSVSEAQVHEFMSLVSTNPNPLVPKMLGGTKGFTRKSFPQDPDMALFTCMVLPETNLFTPHSLQMMRESVCNGKDPQNDPRRNFWLSDSPLGKRALLAGWMGWKDFNITPQAVSNELHVGQYHESDFANEYLLARESAWSWVQSQRWDVKRANESTLTQLRWLRAVNCLDLVDRKKLIQQIAAVQTLSAHPPGNPPIHDWKDVRGLFFTPCYPALQDTYFALAALEILGGLDRIDRNACIDGILRVHGGKGFFKSPDSGGYNEYHIDGSAEDTIAAYESLRILGALDRIKDLDQWQFRTDRRHLAKDEITWKEIEAWVAQQRLQRIIAERTQNPSAPFRSLLVP